MCLIFACLFLNYRRQTTYHRVYIPFKNGRVKQRSVPFDGGLSRLLDAREKDNAVNDRW